MSVCVYCRNSLPDQASYCAKCSKWQSRTRNNILSLSAIATAFTVIAGFVAFIATSIPELQKRYLLAEPLSVVELRYIKGGSAYLVAANQSLSDIYVGAITFFFPSKDATKFSHEHNIREIVKPGESLAYEKLDNADLNLAYLLEATVNQTNGAAFKHAWREKCYRLEAAAPSDRSWTMQRLFMEKDGNSLSDVKHEAFLSYFSEQLNTWRDIPLDTAVTIKLVENCDLDDTAYGDASE